MKKCLALFLLLIAAHVCYAQTDAWDEFAEEFLDDYGDEETEGMALYEELLELHRNPVNINLATREDLLRMPFLNAAQADSIVSLVKKSHGLLSMGELMFVKNLEKKERTYISLFFFCPDNTTFFNRGVKADTTNTQPARDKNYRPYNAPDGKRLVSTISATLGVPLYKREGFRSHSREVLEQNPNRQYLGNNLSTTLRYRSTLNNRITWGLTAQKDEGEPFASGRNTLYDSYSAFLSGKGGQIVEKWVVGDFYAHFGLGLTIGAANSSPLNIISTLQPRQEGFTAHTSTEEALFLRGGAIALRLNKLRIMAFTSWRKLDATLYNDSISTIITSGYHRTELEMSKRNNVAAFQGGVAASVDLNMLKVGLNITHTHYDTPFRQPTALYRKYYFQGKDFGNYSLSYSFRKEAFSLWGEVATSRQGGLAALHQMQYARSYKLILDFAHRYYSTHYLATSAQSLKVGSRIQNEHGIMAGLTYHPSNLWAFKTFVDFAHYPFAVYLSKNPKNAITAMAQAEYLPYATTSWLLRYKFSRRPDDNAAGIPDTKRQHNLKAQFRYAQKHLSLTTSSEMLIVQQPDKPTTAGWMLAQKASVKIASPTTFNAAIALFHTDSYSEALRLYEPVLLYSAGYPICYHHGQRASLSALHKLGPLSIAAKYALTHYTNRSSVGSGLRLYNGSTLQDVLFQLILNI